MANGKGLPYFCNLNQISKASDSQHMFFATDYNQLNTLNYTYKLFENNFLVNSGTEKAMLLQ